MLLANRQVALLLQAPYAVVLPCRAPTDTCCAKIGVTKTCSTTCGQTTSHTVSSVFAMPYRAITPKKPGITVSYPSNSWALVPALCNDPNA